MPATRQVLAVLLLALAGALSLVSLSATRSPALETGRLGTEVEAAQLTFSPATAAADRQAVLTAIAAARPEARALIERVDGLVTVSVGSAGNDAVGLTQGNLDGYTVTLDLAAVAPAGARSVSRLVLHELGHVVDHALLEPDLQATLDAGIPAGYACRPGENTSGCATREERFAETFAKWATRDIGINVSLGYKVLPPPDLDAWGAGLRAVSPS